MITKEPGAKIDKMRITFMLPASFWADTIHVVGDFNRWSPTATPLRLDDMGWSVTLDLDAGRSYQYRYLVDGVEWLNDCHADCYELDHAGVEISVVVTAPTVRELLVHEFGTQHEPPTWPERAEPMQTPSHLVGWQRVERPVDRSLVRVRTNA